MPAVDVEHLADQEQPGHGRATPSSPDRFRRARRRRPSPRRRCSRASRRPAAATRPARATRRAAIVAAEVRERRRCRRCRGWRSSARGDRRRHASRRATSGPRPSGRVARQFAHVAHRSPSKDAPAAEVDGDRLPAAVELARGASAARRSSADRAADAEVRPQQRAGDAAATARRRSRRRARRRATTPDRSAMHGRRRPRAAAASSAGVVGTIVWPRRRAIAKPAPSLPLFGSDVRRSRARRAPRGARRVA